MIGKCGEPNQRSIALKRRHTVADGLGGIRWHSGPNRRPKLLQSAAGGFGYPGNVFVDVFGAAITRLRRHAVVGFGFFYAVDPTIHRHFQMRASNQRVNRLFLDASRRPTDR
jgi:hypothetical protein